MSSGPHHPLHPLRLVADGRHELAPGLLVDGLVAQRGGRAGDGGERRAQVVRDRGEERAPQRLRLGAHGGLPRTPHWASVETSSPMPNIMAGEEVAAVGDVQRERGRHEKVVVGEDAHRGRGHRRPPAQEHGGDEDGHHVEHLDVGDVERRPGGGADGGGPDHERRGAEVAPSRPGADAACSPPGTAPFTV